jgi:hypothetical protein
MIIAPGEVQPLFFEINNGILVYTILVKVCENYETAFLLTGKDCNSIIDKYYPVIFQQARR